MFQVALSGDKMHSAGTTNEKGLLRRKVTRQRIHGSTDCKEPQNQSERTRPPNCKILGE